VGRRDVDSEFSRFLKRNFYIVSTQGKCKGISKNETGVVDRLVMFCIVLEPCSPEDGASIFFFTEALASTNAFTQRRKPADRRHSHYHHHHYQHTHCREKPQISHIYGLFTEMK
jgi:hypothetical protein